MTQRLVATTDVSDKQAFTYVKNCSFTILRALNSGEWINTDTPGGLPDYENSLTIPINKNIRFFLVLAEFLNPIGFLQITPVILLYGKRMSLNSKTIQVHSGLYGCHKAPGYEPSFLTLKREVLPSIFQTTYWSDMFDPDNIDDKKVPNLVFWNTKNYLVEEISLHFKTDSSVRLFVGYN